MVTIILTFFGILGCLYLYVLVKDVMAHRSKAGGESYFVAFGIGLVTDFFDALGVGSFATTTLLFKVTKLLKNDRLLPGTLNTAHTFPALLQAFIFITMVEVEPLTLISMLVAAMLGGWIGAKVVTRIPEKKVQMTMGFALLATAGLMAASELGLIKLLGEGNDAVGLHGGALVIAVVGNFILGALMTAGVGLYAPCMAMVYMLGLNPLVAFPIMMGSCAAIMPVASIQFVKSGSYSRRITVGIAIGGSIGVMIAAFFVKNLDLSVLIWLIIAVVTYTGISMLLKSRKQTT